MKLASAGPALLALILSGCGGYVPPPVTVVGEPTDLRQLAGGWHGSFENKELQRRGYIDFHMTADADSAFGEVNMYMEHPSRPVWERPGDGPASEPGALPPWQRIRFVRVEGGYVSGEMVPIYEPRCGCYVVSTFLGRIRGPVIEGTFTARSERADFQTSGTWRVERTEPAPP